MFSHLSVKDCMKNKVITFLSTQTIIEVIGIMLKEEIGGAPVLNSQSELIGIISLKDCLDAIITDQYFDQHYGVVSTYMSKNVKTASQDSALIDLALEFSHCTYHRFPVIDDRGKIVGIVSRRDILTAMKNIFDDDHDTGRTTGHRG